MIDNDHACQIAECLVDSLEWIPPELIVLPKNHDLVLRIESWI
jgi:hypothetical protein